MTSIRRLATALIFSALSLGVSMCQADAHPELVGVWTAGARSTEAKYGNIKITSDHLYFSFDRKRWKCPTAFEIVADGSIPAGGDLRDLLPTDTGHYVKVNVGPSQCTNATYWVFTFSKDSPSYLGLVEFQKDQMVAVGHLFRVDAQK